jgi:hypothetical protein
MRSYVTHYFAHEETLERAERWLLQTGFTPGQIETHREGVLWISVLTEPGGEVGAQMVFNAAERLDPSGWPSFWELARVPHAHVEAAPVMTDVAALPLAPQHIPIGWNPPDVLILPDRDEDEEFLDTAVRFA